MALLEMRFKLNRNLGGIWGWGFLIEMLTSPKLRESWHKKFYFLKLNICVYLNTQILSVRHKFNDFQTWSNFTPSPIIHNKTKSLKRPLKLGLKPSPTKNGGRHNTLLITFFITIITFKNVNSLIKQHL